MLSVFLLLGPPNNIREGLHKRLTFPRRLKPRCNCCTYRGTEFPPFQNRDLFRASLGKYVQAGDNILSANVPRLYVAIGLLDSATLIVYDK